MFVYSTKEFNKMAQQNLCYLKKKMASKFTFKKGKIAGPKFCPIYDKGNFVVVEVINCHDTGYKKFCDVILNTICLMLIHINLQNS